MPLTVERQSDGSRGTRSGDNSAVQSLIAVATALKSAPAGQERDVLLTSYLTLIAELLQSAGLSPEHVAPLVELSRARAGAAKPGREDRRAGHPPSEAVLARGCAVIDLLIWGGFSEEQAAQKVMRQLLSKGVSAPSDGGDSRGWRRLLKWRARLQNGLVSEAVQAEHKKFRAEIDAIPAHVRIDRALSHCLWDKRRN